MKGQEQWEELIKHLASICCALSEEIAKRAKKEVPVRICHALLQKGFDTLRAIQLLYKESLPLQAQVLVRVLLEVRMDFEIFLRLFSDNPEQAARRVIDAMMLEKIKQQRESKFRGLELIEDAPTPEELLRIEEELVKRYGKDDAKGMRKYGFSGLSIEARAQETGLSDLYHVVYRNLSRNVHSTDYMEHFRAQGMAASSKWADYEDERDHVVLSTAITCVWQMVDLANAGLDCRLGDELRSCWQIFTGFEHWVHLPTGRDQ